MKPVYMRRGDEVIKVDPTSERDKHEKVRLLRREGFRESDSPGTKRIARIKEVRTLRD